jgi:hypothetical protein
MESVVTTREIAKAIFGQNDCVIRRNYVRSNGVRVRALNTVIDLDGKEIYRPVEITKGENKVIRAFK